MKLAKSEILSVPNIRAIGFESETTDLVMGVSTDSRTTQPGDVFFAIRGEKMDGHDFVTKAIGAGAGVVVVDKKWADSNGTMLVSINVPRLIVEDTTVALGDLAAYYRAKFKIPFIAIAGSNGKTTTKNMVSAVLGTKYKVLSTDGNLNNQIGVPQTLFRLTEEHDLAVVEIGTNHFAELEYLCRILAPTHGLITNIGNEHLEFFGSLEGVAKAEGELLDWLRSNKGTFFFNKDDKHITRRLRKNRGTKNVSFGFRAKDAEVKGTILAMDGNGCARLRIRQKGRNPFEVQLSAAGEQNACNALAAVAVGTTMRIPATKITKALRSFSPAGKRMEIIHLNGLTVLNDTYNANPDSVLAALKTLRSMKTDGRRIAVLGDMLELGKSGEKEHRTIGKTLAQSKVDYLFTFGDLSKLTNDAAKLEMKQHFNDKSALAERVAAVVSAGDLVLVKGSRGMKMEEVVAVLQQKFK